MSKELIKPDSKFGKLKRIFLEQLWLILLLAPLLIIGILVGQNFQSNNKSEISAKQMVSASGSSALRAVSAEISSAELALIVAKPLSELLAMDVYLDNKFRSRGRTRVSSLELTEPLGNETNNKLLKKGDARHLLVGEAQYDRTDG